MVADISSPRRFVFERPVGAYWQYQPRKVRMSEESASEGSNERRKRLGGPDLTRGVELSMVPDGTMLLGHARGQMVFLVRRGDELFAIGAICTHYGAPLEQGLLVGDTMPMAPCLLLGAHR